MIDKEISTHHPMLSSLVKILPHPKIGYVKMLTLMMRWGPTKYENAMEPHISLRVTKLHEVEEFISDDEDDIVLVNEDEIEFESDDDVVGNGIEEKAKIVEFDLGYNARGYLTMCRRCNGGCDINTHYIEVGRQCRNL